MQKIIIGFSRPHSKLAILAHIIRLVEGKTPYSHVYIKWHSDDLQRDLIYEARGNGVNFTNSQLFHHTNLVVDEFELPVNSEQKRDIVRFCVDNARTSYGSMQVIGIGIVKLVAKLGFKIKNPFTSGNVCSEIAARILKILDRPIKEELDNIGPRCVHEILKNGKN